MGTRRKKIISGLVASVIAVSSVPYAALAAVEPPNITGLFQKGDHVKIEWSTPMVDADIITQTGFESGQEIPSLVWGGSNPTGNQSIVDVGGNHVLRVLDTITGKTGNAVNYPDVNSTYSLASYAGKSLPDNQVLSINYKVRNVAATDSKIHYAVSTGWMKQGFPVRDTAGQPVLYDQLVDWNNPPSILRVKRTDGSAPTFADGYVLVLVSSKGTNYDYGVMRYQWDGSKNAFINPPGVDTKPWITSSPNGTPFTLRSDVFYPNDELLMYSEASYEIPHRQVGGMSGWTTLSANVYIPSHPYYDTIARGLGFRQVTTTNGEVQVDDLKIGYATEAEVLRNGSPIYRGYLSDFEDTAATDKEKPNAPSGVKFAPTGDKIEISWNPALDVGTPYNYQVIGHPKNTAAEYSEANQVEVLAGLRGYAVKVDNNPNTVLTSDVVTTTPSLTVDRPKGTFYVHVAAVDNAGNVSTTQTMAVSDLNPPTGTIAVSTTEYTNGSVVLTAQGYDAETWVASITTPDGQEVVGDRATYTATQNGDYTFTLNDYNGNTTTLTKQVTNIDKDGPTIELTTPPAEWSKAPSLVDVKITDVQSGVDTNTKSYALTKTAAAPTDWLPLTGDTVEIETPGSWYLHVRAADRVGNETTQVSSVVNVQGEPATPTLEVAGVTEDTVTVSWPLAAGETSGYRYVLQDVESGQEWQAEHPATSYKIDGLTPGVEKRLRLKAVNRVGESAYSAEVVARTLPAMPTDLAVAITPHQSGSVDVSFGSVLSAEDYKINVTDMETQQEVYTKTVTGMDSHVVSGLTGGRMYAVQVQARNASGYGKSAVYNFRTVPSAPSGFTLVGMGVSENSVELGWYALEGVDEYELQRDQTVVDSVYREPASVVVSYKDINLEAGTVYNYSVAGKNESGLGEYSTLEVETAPNAPTGVTATPLSPSEVRVDWIPSKGALAHTLYDQDMTWGSGFVFDKTYTITGLEPGETKVLTLLASSQYALGGATTVTVQSSPAKQTEPELLELEANRVNFEIPVVAGATKYKLEVAGTEYETGAGLFNLSSLTGGTPYAYTLTPGNAAGWGEAYTGSFTTKPAAPSGVKVTKQESTTVTAVWDAVEGAKGYVVYDEDGTKVGEAENAAYTWKELEPGQKAAYTVAAWNESGESVRTPIQVETTPGALLGEDGKPVRAQITDRTEHEVTVTWPEVKGATGYRVVSELGTLVDQTQRKYRVTGLASATTVTDLQVVPYNAAGEGPAVAVETFETKPSGAFTVAVAAKGKGLELTFDPQLAKEVFVVERGGKEVYRGEGTPVVDEAAPLTKSVTYTVHTENQAGEKSKAVSVVYTPPASANPEPSTSGGGSSYIPPTKPVETKPEAKPETPSPTPKPVPSDQFTDIGSTFSRQEITALAKDGLLKGYPDGTFGPDKPITRVEYAALLVRASKAHVTGTLDLPYQDITKTAWYLPELSAAVTSGIAEGFSKTEFGPSQFITREQAVKMTVRVKQGEVEGYTDLAFTDADRVAEWAKPYVQVGSDSNLIKGYPDGTFRPKANMTRAEAAMLIYTWLQQKNEGR